METDCVIQSVSAFFVVSHLFASGCGGKETVDINSPTQIGGGASNGGSAGAEAGASTSTGGNTISGYAGDTGCSGGPIEAFSAPYDPSANGQCGVYKQLLVVSGIPMNLLDSFAVRGGFDASHCVYPFPTSLPLLVVDAGLGYAEPYNLSVLLTISDGTTELLPNVNSAGYCTDSAGGWYLDNNSNPTIITFCQCTCARLSSIGVTIDLVNFPRACPP